MFTSVHQDSIIVATLGCFEVTQMNMRNKIVKILRKDVMLKMYVGDGVSESDVRNGKHDIMKELEFKRIFRARKRNEKKKIQIVNHMLTAELFDPKLKKMSDIRIRNQRQRRNSIKSRKY